MFAAVSRVKNRPQRTPSRYTVNMGTSMAMTFTATACVPARQDSALMAAVTSKLRIQAGIRMEVARRSLHSVPAKITRHVSWTVPVRNGSGLTRT